MKNVFGEKSTRERPAELAGVGVEASLWVLLPKAFGAILLSDVLILLIFWLVFGEFSAFAFGFVIFLSVLQILMIVGLRFRDRKRFHATKSPPNDWLDKLGAWWLMACAFGAFFGWISAQLAASWPQFETAFLALAVVFSIVLPVLTMLPNLRYLETRIAVIQIPILFFVTILPLLSGFKSVFKIWQRLNL
jgi:hypothetical protein